MFKASIHSGGGRLGGYERDETELRGVSKLSFVVVSNRLGFRAPGRQPARKT